MQKRKLKVFMLAAIATVTACVACSSSTTSVEPLPAGGHHILFVGNSLTYVNDLPWTVAAIAMSAGDTIRYRTAAGPNLALIDHLNGATNAVAEIKAGGWEYVVLSQGPTPRGICRDSLTLWTKLFDPHIRAVGARPALFMTWPSLTDRAIFDDVRISFEQAAQSVGGTFMPAGEAWRAAWTVNPDLALYGADGFHPSELGTFLAALEIYERITGRDVRTIPARAFAGGRELNVSVETIRLLQRAAHEANTKFPAQNIGARAPDLSCAPA